MKSICPLCHTPSTLYYEDTQRYCRCPQCCAIFVIQEDLPKPNEEKQRYELHDTDTEDAGYRKFVSPITSKVLQEFTPTDKGLDYGAGRSAIISCVLQEAGYSIYNYDPYFHPDTTVLQEHYDYITSCEVIEHFYNPYKDFTLLKKMLNPGGRLYLMTDIYDDKKDFGSWYYKNDPTHVFIYTKETFLYIAKAFRFQSVTIEKRCIVFSL